jgi:hypothetical protein
MIVNGVNRGNHTFGNSRIPEYRVRCAGADKFLRKLYISSSDSVLRAPHKFSLTRQGKSDPEVGTFSFIDNELCFNRSELINFTFDSIIALAISLGFTVNK